MNRTPIQNLEKALNRFILQDICNVALQEFPELTWEEIQQKIEQNGPSIMSKKNVIQIMLDAVNHLSDEVIDARATKLTLYYVGLTDTKTWNAFRLKDKIDNFNERSNKLDNIKSAVLKTDISADISLLKFRGKLIIGVVKKTKRKYGGIVKAPPIYLQHFPNQRYIFICNGKIDSDLITAVITGLGYTKYEFCQLDGPNVSDLLTILRNKEGGMTYAEVMDIELDLEPEIQFSDGVTNYSQHAKRAKYAEQLYGKDPPRLERISVTVKDDTWNSNGLDAMEGTSIQGMELTIQSPNVIELFKEMIAKGIITTPIPPYIENILTAGRNKFKINPTL